MRGKQYIGRLGKRIGQAVIVSITVVALGLGALQLTGNFHEVVGAELYRSAQLEPQALERYVKTYAIRSVINLRGSNQGSPWYDAEVQKTAELGVKHIDFRMSSSHALKKDEALELIALMRDAPKPLLIHCRAGADRTGLASALYLAAIAGQSEWQAEKQLWLTYGHVPLCFTGAYAMNDTFESLEPYLGFKDS